MSCVNELVFWNCLLWLWNIEIVLYFVVWSIWDWNGRKVSENEWLEVSKFLLIIFGIWRVIVVCGLIWSGWRELSLLFNLFWIMKKEESNLFFMGILDLRYFCWKLLMLFRLKGYGIIVWNCFMSMVVVLVCGVCLFCLKIMRFFLWFL